jgi:hypothetical protein
VLNIINPAAEHTLSISGFTDPAPQMTGKAGH